MDEDFYIALLYKKLDKRIEPDEQSQLDNWLKDSAEHRQLADGIEKVWEVGGRFQQDVEVDLDAEFAQLEERIADDEEEAPVRRLTPRRERTSISVWWRIAAGIALFIVAGMALRNYLQQPGTTWEVVNTTDDQLDLMLADGSKVWINQQSTFEYPDGYSKNERRVKLKGEAFFDVAKEADRPFIIETDKGSIQVLGTSFNVRSLPGEQQLEVEVHTGLVRLTSTDGQRSIEIEAGETAVLDLQNQQLDKNKDLSPNAAAWQSKRLVFIDAPLEMVLQDLEQYYGQQIVLNNRQMANCPFTSTFKEAKLENILQIVTGVFGLKVEQEGKTITLKGGQCG